MRENPPRPALTRQGAADLIPRAGILAAWWNCWAVGACGAEAVIDALSPFGRHVFVGLDGDPSPLIVGLARLRPTAAPDLTSPERWRMRVALPVAGDAGGLPGPARFNEAAIEAGQAVILSEAGIGLIPDIGADVTTWTCRAVIVGTGAAPPVRPEQAVATVRSALMRALTSLEDLDPAVDRDAVRVQLTDLDKRINEIKLPNTLDQRLVHTAVTAARVLGAVAIVEQADNARPETPDLAARAEALRGLARDARHALAAALSG